MTEATKTSIKSSNIASLIDTFTSLKREIYSYLDQALEIDQKLTISKIKPSPVYQPGAYDNAIILYEKSLKLTGDALRFYETNKDVLSTQSEAIGILTKLNAIKIQAIERLSALKSKIFVRKNFKFQKSYIFLKKKTLNDRHLS